MFILQSQANGNGDAVSARPGTDKLSHLHTVYVYGTWDGATAIIQISPDGTNWFTATDSQGNDASFTDDGVVNITALYAYVRGVVSGGGGSESINMRMM